MLGCVSDIVNNGSNSMSTVFQESSLGDLRGVFFVALILDLGGLPWRGFGALGGMLWDVWNFNDFEGRSRIRGLLKSRVI